MEPATPLPEMEPATPLPEMEPATPLELMRAPPPDPAPPPPLVTELFDGLLVGGLLSKEGLALLLVRLFRLPDAATSSSALS